MKILPCPTIKNGKPQWVVHVPKDLIESEKVKRRFFVDESEANAFCVRLESVEMGISSAFFRLDRASQSIVSAALAKVGMDATKLLMAVEFYNQKHDVAVKPLKLMFSEFYTAKLRSGKKKRYLQALDCSIGQFLKGRGDSLAHEIKITDVQEWIDGNNYALSTKRSYLTDLRTFFNYALKHRYCLENPVHGVEWPSLGDMPAKIYTPGQIAEIFKAAMAFDRGMVQYLALRNFAGLRASEARWLPPEKISDNYVTIDGEIAKTRARRLIELNEPLKAWLEIKGELPVVNLERRLERIFPKAGVKPIANGFRHSFCSYGLVLWGPQRTSNDAGHSERVLYRHYRAVATKEQAKQWSDIRP